MADSYVSHLQITPHGGRLAAELEALGIDPISVLDFSVCINPYGPPGSVRDAVARTGVGEYPDSETVALRREIARRWGCAVDQVLCGNGSVELIWCIAAAYLRRGDVALVAGPTFGEYAAAALALGAAVHEVRMERDVDEPAPDGLLAGISARRPKAVFVCNPNNPTGALWTVDALRRVADAMPDGLLIVDEAYLEFVPGAESLIPERPGNVVVLRSMTKDYGMPGVRLGYAVGAPSVIAALRLVRPAWSVNALAQAAGLAALQDGEFLPRTVPSILESSRALRAAFEAAGFPVHVSRAHYFLVEAGDGAALRRRLLRHGILVRDCASFGLPRHVRVSPRTTEETRAFIEIIRKDALAP